MTFKELVKEKFENSGCVGAWFWGTLHLLIGDPPVPFEDSKWGAADGRPFDYENNGEDQH